MTVVFADGTKQTFEVAAGSGYYSQSTADCFVSYSNANLPRHATVRWPTGTVSEHELKQNNSHVTLTAP